MASIQLKHGSASNVPSTLLPGEFAINVSTAQLWYGSGSTNTPKSELKLDKLTAQEYILSSSISFITTSYSSGSTEFGDSADDSHTFTGTLSASGQISTSAGVTATNYIGNISTVDQPNIRQVGTLLNLTASGILSSSAGITASNAQIAGNVSASGTFLGSSVYIIGPITSSGIISASGGITASNAQIAGNISASSTIVASNLSGTNTGDQNLTNLAITGSNVLFANITASGIISASGGITGSNAQIAGNISASGEIQALNMKIDGQRLTINDDNLTLPDTGLTVAGPITASGNISSSGNLIGVSASLDYIKTTGNISASAFYAAEVYRLDDSGGTTRHILKRDGNILAIGNSNFDELSLRESTTITGSLKTTLGIETSTTITTVRSIYSGENITGSNIISSSGGITSSNAQIAGDISASAGLHGLTVYTRGPITASGIISSSRAIMGVSVYARGPITASGIISSSDSIFGGELFEANQTLNERYAPFSGHSGTDTVGALNAGSITSGFGSINNGVSTIAGGAATFTTVDTGQGANELYDMDQNVKTDSDVKFSNITASGNISSSGTITANNFVGAPIFLGRASQYIGTANKDNFYYGNTTQGFYHHQHSGKISSYPLAGEQAGQGVQHNAVLLPMDVYDIELRANARTNTENAGFAFYVMKNTRPHPDLGNSALVFMGSASVAAATVGTDDEGKFHRCDLTGSHTYRIQMTASAEEQLYVLFEPKDSNQSAVKYYWTITAKTK